MKLQITIPLKQEDNQIDYSSKVVLLGSCFTEHVGGKLAYFKFQTHQNLFGIIFNPVSISKLVSRALNSHLFTEKDIFEKDGQWHCLEVHSLIFSSEKDHYLKLLNSKLQDLKSHLEQASHIIFTFGTAWVYEYVKSKEVVANCHKIPQKEFKKQLLSVSTISEALQKTAEMIRKINPKSQVIYTVSPVRHIKDGFVENSLSKAHLLAGIHDLLNRNSSIIPHTSFYFPSYEIMMDELRDYRFYERDMLHPNETAIEIIWQKFNAVWVSKETLKLQKEIDIIQKGLQHRPFNAESDEHLKFQKNLQEKIQALQAKLPHSVF